jgi:predicted dehydrogenase
MAERRLGIIVNGATGGLATHQHLRALLTLRREGGLPLANGDRVMPDPILVGRNAAKLQALAAASGIARWTTDLDAALGASADTEFFDAATTGARYDVVRRAIAAGKDIYCEKPVARTLDEAMTLVRAAEQAGIRHGTVQDKLFLPGFRKLARLKESGFFGRILEVRLEFGRWIFDGEHQPAQRPSWNYRKRDGGGLILDMFPHWRYLIDRLVGEIQAVSCICRTQIARRLDEQGRPYEADAEDAAFAQMELEGGIIATVNSSWCTRIRRDDVITIQVDGTRGSAVAGPHDCVIQPDAATPKPVLTVDGRQPASFYDQWLAVPDNEAYANSYRCGWELFIRHVVDGQPFPSPLLEGAKGVQLAELSYLSDRERRWVTVPRLVATGAA